MEKVKVLRKYPPQRDNILLILHELQRLNPQNYLTEDDLRLVSQYLSLPLSEVAGVATFYSLFSLKPRGKYVIRVCKSPACHLEGAVSLLQEIKNFLGIEEGDTTADGMFTLETSECLGHCAEAPVMMVNDQVFTKLSGERVGEIIDRLRRS